MIGIIDYDAGNLLSVRNSLRFLGHNCITSANIYDLSSCDKLILPGVGAFPHAMIKLAERGLDTFIVDQVTKGKPILGICLGMQVLFDVGNEFNRAAGLGLLPGEVRQIRTHHKLPHIGWNSLNFTNNSKLLDGIPEDSFVYFVHSYICECSNPQDVVATANYGENVTAIVQRGHIIGCQFHPEKSGSLGLRIYDNFAGL